MSMMKSHDLPTEICHLIFQYLPLETVYQCIFVCKSWSSAAAHFYYTNFALTGRMISSLQRTMVRHNSEQINAITQVTIQGALIRTLEIHCDVPREFRLNKEDFSCLISHMTNLRRIYLQSTAKYRHYVRYLRDIKTNNTHLEHLEDIPIKFNNPADKAIASREYFSACYKYRKTMTHLQVQYPLVNFDIRGQHYLQFLPEFQNLTHLSIDNNSFNGIPLICPIFKACLNLINFAYKSPFSIISDAAGELLSFTILATNNTI